MNKNWIPNGFTSLNIALGTLSLIMSWQHEWQLAALFILGALFADALDGRTARYFGVSGDFGRELDSLCDVVSFGVAPGVLLYGWQLYQLPWYLGALVAIFFAVCGAMRLARFNINTTNVKGYFMGLPIPTAGCMVATYVLSNAPLPAPAVAIMASIVAYTMVSEVHYPDFKGQSADKMQKKALLASLVIGFCLWWDETSRWSFVLFFMYFIFGILNTVWNRLDRR